MKLHKKLLECLTYNNVKYSIKIWIYQLLTGIPYMQAVKKALQVAIQSKNNRLHIWDSIPFLYFTITKMRKITLETTRAFASMQAITKSNVYVDFGINGHMYYYLHNNLIGDYDEKNGKLTISDAGRQTNTTKERLNGILDAFGINAGIYQKNWQRYIGNEKRTGEKTFNV